MKIKVLLVIPGKEVQIVKIPASLKFIKAFIGKKLLKIKLDDNNILMLNNDAVIDEFNRLFKQNILLGTFFVVSIKNNHLVSMKRKDIRKYANMFKLRKHQKKIDFYKNFYLENYYSKQRELNYTTDNNELSKNVA